MRTRNVIIIAVIAIIATLVAAYFFWGRNQKSDTPTPAATTQVQPSSPCADTAALRAALNNKNDEIRQHRANFRQAITERDALQKALDNEIKKCRPPLSGGDTLNIVIVPNKNTTGKHAKKTTVGSSSSEGSPQSISSEYRAAEKPSVETSVTGGDVVQDVFCINVRDMDKASYWPELAIENGVNILGAVFNRDRSGHNISIYPVHDINGLYGTTDDGIIFVKADLLDQFGPTTVRASGTPNGWRTWVEMTLVDLGDKGKYYVTPPLRNR